VPAHPLIGFRSVAGRREPIVLGSGLSVAELVELVRARQSSVSDAARLAGLDERLVQAAVNYDEEHGGGDTAAGGDNGKSALQLAAQAFALFAGITSIVYVAGSLVLALRLAFSHVPWEPVLGQLPREFVVSTGAGQILLPALAVAAIYLTFRLLRGSAANAPNAKRWKESNALERVRIVALTALVAVMLLAPGVLFVNLRDRELLLDAKIVGLSEYVWLPAIGFLVIFVTTGLFRELRALVARRYSGRWNISVAPAAAMSGIYALAVVPALVAFWAAWPLTDAKVCATKGFEKSGLLVGQTSDRVYLGEHRPFHRRLAVIPLSQVEQLFIGPVAGDAVCNVPDAQAAITAQAQASEASRAAQQANVAARALATSNKNTLAAWAGRVADAAGEAGLAAFAVGKAAESSVPEQARKVEDSGDRAIQAAQRLRTAAQRLENSGRAAGAGQRTSLQGQAADAAETAQKAAGMGQTLADHMNQRARRAALASS
jgi:hypothetical protein